MTQAGSSMWLRETSNSKCEDWAISRLDHFRAAVVRYCPPPCDCSSRPAFLSTRVNGQVTNSMDVFVNKTSLGARTLALFTEACFAGSSQSVLVSGKRVSDWELGRELSLFYRILPLDATVMQAEWSKKARETPNTPVTHLGRLDGWLSDGFGILYAFEVVVRETVTPKHPKTHPQPWPLGPSLPSRTHPTLRLHDMLLYAMDPGLGISFPRHHACFTAQETSLQPDASETRPLRLAPAWTSFYWLRTLHPSIVAAAPTTKDLSPCFQVP